MAKSKPKQTCAKRATEMIADAEKLAEDVFEEIGHAIPVSAFRVILGEVVQLYKARDATA